VFAAGASAFADPACAASVTAAEAARMPRLVTPDITSSPSYAVALDDYNQSRGEIFQRVEPEPRRALCNRRHSFRCDRKLQWRGFIKVRLVVPTKLREVRSEPHKTQSAAQTETDFAMMSVWLMICLINAVILFGFY
jgi:hypothetical protein